MIVGAGPAGLACAIRLKQLNAETNICVLEKASAVGAHSLSGAVLEPAAARKAAAELAHRIHRHESAGRRRRCAAHDQHGSIKLPNWAVNLSPMNNHGNFIISLGQLTPWLAQQAEALGVDIFPGFAAAEAVFDENGRRQRRAHRRHGPRTRTARPVRTITPGVEIHAKITVLAEGSRGRHPKQLHQEVQPARRRHRSADVRPGLQGAVATAARPREARAASNTRFGWPLDSKTYGGSFLYHLDDDRVYVGYVVGLNYKDPRLKPFEAFQQFKNHPRIKPLLEGGEILSAGARTIAAGGYQSLPKLEMPGALLIGDCGGTLNVFKIKGIHQAIRSAACWPQNICTKPARAAGFDARWRASEGHRELHSVRNFKPAFKSGL